MTTSSCLPLAITARHTLNRYKVTWEEMNASRLCLRDVGAPICGADSESQYRKSTSLLSFRVPVFSTVLLRAAHECRNSGHCIFLSLSIGTRCRLMESETMHGTSFKHCTLPVCLRIVKAVLVSSVSPLTTGFRGIFVYVSLSPLYIHDSNLTDRDRAAMLPPSSLDRSPHDRYSSSHIPSERWAIDFSVHLNLVLSGSFRQLLFLVKMAFDCIIYEIAIAFRSGLMDIFTMVGWHGDSTQQVCGTRFRCPRV